jgi:glutamate-1-semialdehyde 2,1-aminomutase
MSLSDIIPGGCHTYSKGNDCFPANAPEYLVSGDGCYVVDNKGKRYIDWGMGLRSVILGHSYEKVNHAVIEAVMEGTNFCRPTLYEKRLAELLIKIVPCAEMVKFGKSGSDVTSAAIRLARAYTGRNIILVARENPFISQHDWFIGTTPTNGGIPYDDNVKHFSFETLTSYSWEASINNLYQWSNIAAIVLDPATINISTGKLGYLRQICDRYGVVMILDEVISGFRYDLHGIQGLYGITPDLATFGKAMANGYSVSALCGKKDIMQLGDRKYGNVFLLSGTYNAETPALAAAIVTIEEIANPYLKVNDHINRVGYLLSDGIKEKIRHYDLGDYIRVNDYNWSNPSLCFSNMTYKTIFDQSMVECGVLMPYIAPSYSHKEHEINNTICAVDYSLMILEKAIKSGRLSEYLMNGWVEKPVFRRCEKEL